LVQELPRIALQWRQLRPLPDADADRADLELRLIKLTARAGNDGAWRKAVVHMPQHFCADTERVEMVSIFDRQDSQAERLLRMIRKLYNWSQLRLIAS
jgi:hypothetical protein